MTRSGFRWHITVIDAAENRVLFAGYSDNADEIHAVAAEARRLRPAAQIIIAPPMGQPRYEYP